MRRSALLAILILAACAGDGETATPAVAPPVLTTIGDSAPVTPTPSTTDPATSTTTTATTTTTVPPANAAPAFGLTHVAFGESSFVIITNWGNATGNLAGYWLSQGTLHKSLPEIQLARGEQALLGLARVPPPELAGIAVTVFLGPAIGVLEPTSGEIALHSNSSFEDPNSIVAYVEWGQPGNLWSIVAIEAGIWSEGAVDVFDEAPSISSGVYPATSSADWFADVGG